MRNDSIIEPIYLSIKQLAIGKGNIKERLNSISCHIYSISENDIPDNYKKEFHWIKSQMTKYKSRNGSFLGNIYLTMHRIRLNTGQKIASRLFTLYSNIQSERNNPLV